MAQLTHSLQIAVADTRPALMEADLEQVHRRLQLICDQMRDVLAAGECLFEDLTGLPFDDEVIEKADVDGWRRNEAFESEVVAETVTPAIEIRRKLYRRARIVAGGPPL
jgi:hypothetical protein